MALVSTRSFHFEQFGGYSGLSYALAADLVEIPDLLDGELIRPGTYWNCVVDTIVSHGPTKGYSVDFVGPNGDHIHTENYKVLPIGVELGAEVGLTLAIRSPSERHSAGKLFGKYYLIAPGGEVLSEFSTAKELLAHAREHGLVDSLRGLYVAELLTPRTGRRT